MMIEEEAGTYSGTPTGTPTRTRANNGYCAGNFTNVPFNSAKLYPPYLTLPTYARG
jgi:hypothetical protein